MSKPDQIESHEGANAFAGATNRDITFQGLPAGYETLLNETIYPEDAYKDMVYWADLPAVQRAKWVEQHHRKEAACELRDFWQTFKADPLEPIRQYLRSYAVTGVGFFTEGYVLFSVGNILPLFETVWPRCFKRFDVCDKTMVHAISYMEILGIIGGQILVGLIGDWIGRRWGLIQDAAVMCIGTILLFSMWGVTLSGWTVMYGISLLIFSIGVGGEYPMTSTTAMEGVRGQASFLRQDRLHRGRSVALSQPKLRGGSSSGDVPNNIRRCHALLTLLSIPPNLQAPRGHDSLKASRRRGNVTGYDITSLNLVTNHYWHRLFATSLCWFCNGFPFYGNQIFRNIFLSIVTTNSNQVGTLWLYNLINIGCELAGYYLAALLMDHKQYGRKKMQAVGSIMTFILFIIAAGAFPILNTHGAGGKAFQFIYFFSSFWIQLGPNSTTFRLAAEVYHAPVRATAHGFSAAIGKLGALAATVLYNYIGNRTKFWVVSWFGLIDFILTVIFIPDKTGLDLRKQERYWQYVKDGRSQDYHGIAIHPRHLS